MNIKPVDQTYADNHRILSINGVYRYQPALEKAVTTRVPNVKLVHAELMLSSRSVQLWPISLMGPHEMSVFAYETPRHPQTRLGY